MRNSQIDVVKAIGIILMVAGHCGSPLTNYIYLFHMALFIMASGYLFKDNNTESFADLLKYIKRKVIYLGGVYVFWMLMFSLLHNLFIKLHFYSLNDYSQTEYAAFNIIVSKEWTIKEVAINVLKACILHGDEPLLGTFWFLAALLEISIGFAIIQFIIRRFGINKFVIQFIVSFIFLLVGYILSYNNWRLFGVEVFFSCYILFYLGYIMKYIADEMLNRWYIFIALWFISLSTLIVAGIKSEKISINLAMNSYVNPLFMIICSISGWILCNGIAWVISQNDLLKWIFLVIGKNTLIIMCLHLVAFKVINFITTVINDYPLDVIAAYPFIHNGMIYRLGYMIVGVGIPIGLSVIYIFVKNKIKAGNNIIE